VLSAELFRDVLVREQKRAERYDQRFVLFLIQADTLSGAPVPPSSSTVQTFASAAGDTAVVGWYEEQSFLGIIVPDTGQNDADGQFRRALARRLGEQQAATLPIRAYVYSPGSGLQRMTEGPAETLAAEPPLRPSETRDRLKRAFDVVGSLMLLLLLSPVFLVVALLLKLTSPGPVLFRQPRVGLMAARFTILKFRTMRVDADQAVHQQFVTQFIKSSAQLGSAGRKAIFKLTNDSRVTPLGRILRKTSLDELPQLWNVLRGEMSLVGPRPPLPYEVDQYRPWHRRRVVDAKPGITGLWQVKGRSRTTFDEMVRLDIQYARTHSLWLDLRILLATPRAVISGKGAA
jgi:exopolysaccharide biosynthesis polyprenyl glycosylphosphotransferase